MRVQRINAGFYPKHSKNSSPAKNYITYPSFKGEVENDKKEVKTGFLDKIKEVFQKKYEIVENFFEIITNIICYKQLRSNFLWRSEYFYAYNDPSYS